MPRAFEPLAGPPVFVCGSARSGTTWTFDIFDRHPEVFAVCESWLFTQTHGMTSVLAQEYWDLDTRLAWQQRVDVPFGAVQLLPYEEMRRELGELLARWLMRNVQPEHRFVVAKEPLDVGAAAILFPQARFIHVIRDGRDVVLSMRRASETWDPSMGVGLPTGVRALTWRAQLESIRAHRDALGDRYLEVRYESMRADPRSAIRTLFGFAGLPCDDRIVAATADATRLSNYDGRARRSGFRGGGERGDWRAAFGPRDALAFHRAAGDLLVELGYERDARWVAAALARSARLASRG